MTQLRSEDGLELHDDESNSILMDAPSNEDIVAGFGKERDRLAELGEREEDGYDFDHVDVFSIVDDMAAKLAAVKAERAFYQELAIHLMASGIPLNKQKQACRNARAYIRKHYGLNPARAMNEVSGFLKP